MCLAASGRCTSLTIQTLAYSSRVVRRPPTQLRCGKRMSKTRWRGLADSDVDSDAWGRAVCMGLFSLDMSTGSKETGTRPYRRGGLHQLLPGVQVARGGVRS